MTQPSLLDLPEARRKVQKAVPQSSRLTYQAEHARLKGRSERVARWLRKHMNPEGPWHWPTSAELAQFAYMTLDEDGYDVVLYVRRGLSDLQASGAVEKAGTRRCRVTGRTCCTWRLRQR